MHRRLFLMLASLAVATTARAADSIEPGLYEIATRMSDAAPVSQRRCITAADIAKGLESDALPQDCRKTRGTLANGRVDYAATCPDATLAMTGSYTATTFTMDSRMQGKTGGRPFRLETHVTARKVADRCPAE